MFLITVWLVLCYFVVLHGLKCRLYPNRSEHVCVVHIFVMLFFVSLSDVFKLFFVFFCFVTRKTYKERSEIRFFMVSRVV